MGAAPTTTNNTTTSTSSSSSPGRQHPGPRPSDSPIPEAGVTTATTSTTDALPRTMLKLAFGWPRRTQPGSLEAPWGWCRPRCGARGGSSTGPWTVPTRHAHLHECVCVRNTGCAWTSQGTHAAAPAAAARADSTLPTSHQHQCMHTHPRGRSQWQSPPARSAALACVKDSASHQANLSLPTRHCLLAQSTPCVP